MAGQNPATLGIHRKQAQGQAKRLCPDRTGQQGKTLMGNWPVYTTYPSLGPGWQDEEPYYTFLFRWPDHDILARLDQALDDKEMRHLVLGTGVGREMWLRMGRTCKDCRRQCPIYRSTSVRLRQQLLTYTRSEVELESLGPTEPRHY